MKPIPEPLGAEDCPLLKRYPDRLGPVLVTYNLAATSARTLADKFPRELEKPDSRAAVEALAKIRNDLTSKRFKVGFLGPFQCGKSTTLNDLLGQDVSHVGAGSACTSVVTRIIAAPPGTPPTFTLKYLTIEEYLAKRNTLCEWAGIKNPAGRSEVNLLEMLKDYTPMADVTTAQRPVLQMDIPYLRAFLQSYLNYKATVIREEAVFEELPYQDKDRDDLLKHPTTSDELSVAPSKFLLLAEIVDHLPDGSDRPGNRVGRLPGGRCGPIGRQPPDRALHRPASWRPSLPPGRLDHEPGSE